MDRRDKRDDRRPPRDDHRSHRPRYEQDRSRSPPRRDRRDDRRRDRSPPRGGPPPRGEPSSRSDRDRDYQRIREQDRMPPRGRPGDRPIKREALDSKSGSNNFKAQSGKADTRMEDVPEDEDSEEEMARIMGFKDFRTTKNTKVPGNDKNYAVHKNKKAEYRQYMNRVGGFNRPLSPSRT